jgi:hypothetical protein
LPGSRADAVLFGKRREDPQQIEIQLGGGRDSGHYLKSGF